MCSLCGNSCACELSSLEMIMRERVGITVVGWMGKCQDGQSHMRVRSGRVQREGVMKPQEEVVECTHWS